MWRNARGWVIGFSVLYVNATPISAEYTPVSSSTYAMYKPNGYNSASPYLIVDGAEPAIDFLKRVLHATELRRFDDGNGGIIHAEIRIDDTVIMIADAAPPDWPSVASHVHLYVEDVDAVYETAVREGATPVQEPVKKDDEDKRGGFRDPAGTTWWIATRVG